MAQFRCIIPAVLAFLCLFPMEALTSFASTYITENVVVYTLCGVIVLLVVWIGWLEHRVNRLLVGPKAANLEESLLWLREEMKTHGIFREEIEKYLTNVEGRLKGSIRGVETIRFNPFAGSGSGGNQSFATAFLNEEGNGVVISSLFARERTSVFAKPVEKYTSTFELTEEERGAIEGAKAHTKHVN
mgnify:CR=1 FL=1